MAVLLIQLFYCAKYEFLEFVKQFLLLIYLLYFWRGRNGDTYLLFYSCCKRKLKHINITLILFYTGPCVK